MSINRVIQDKSNTRIMINTSIVRDPRISGKAKAFWLYAFSRQHYDQFYPSEMEKHFKEGKEAIRSGLNELEKFGYLHREQVRGEDGRLGPLSWTFYEGASE